MAKLNRMLVLVGVLLLCSMSSCSQEEQQDAVPKPLYSQNTSYQKLLPSDAVILEVLGNGWIVFGVKNTTNRYIFKEMGTGGWLAPYRVAGK